MSATESNSLYCAVNCNILRRNDCPSCLHTPWNFNQRLGQIFHMVFAGVDYKCRSSFNTLPLVGVGDDLEVREVYDALKGLVWAFPAFTHKNAINFLFFNKCVKLQNFIVNASWVYIHDCW